VACQCLDVRSGVLAGTRIRPPAPGKPVIFRHVMRDGGSRGGMTYGDREVPDEFEWAMAEPRREALAVAPGWFRAWPTGDEKWSALNIRGASQVIVNHSREDDRHPNSWTVRALFGDKAVELRVGPYDSKAQAILVANAVLSLAFAPQP